MTREGGGGEEQRKWEDRGSGQHQLSLTCAFPALHLGISHLTKSGKNANFSQELKIKGNLISILKKNQQNQSNG